jgi:hypothetical protein
MTAQSSSPDDGLTVISYVCQGLCLSLTGLSVGARLFARHKQWGHMYSEDCEYLLDNDKVSELAVANHAFWTSQLTRRHRLVCCCMGKQGPILSLPWPRCTNTKIGRISRLLYWLNNMYNSPILGIYGRRLTSLCGTKIHFSKAAITYGNSTLARYERRGR